MSYDEDYRLALQLQQELDALENDEATNAWPAIPQQKTVSNKRKNDDIDDELNATQNLVHPEWENIDPTPDIFSLFGAFDIKFFQGKLQCVELEWSKRMYQCAGICYQRRNGLGMSIIIRLSEPLLKLRSRRDLVETMLHEMIHAYLFILNIREGNGGHGPNFKRLMEGINRVAGTKISVYHSFHDEVEMYKTHIWRCNGICQHRKPFYGWVKRTSNRAPGPNDNWWAKHHETCSGTFVKVSQPEPKPRAKKSKAEPKPDPKLPKITEWLGKPKPNANAPRNTTNLPKSNTNQPRGAAGGFTKSNGGGTVLLPPTAKNRNVATISDDANKDSVLGNVSDGTAGRNLSNVVGFRNLNSSGTSVIKGPSVFGSGGKALGSSASNTSFGASAGGATPSENIRNIWANKFKDNKPQTVTADNADRVKSKVTESTSAWEELDDDIMIHNVNNTVIEIDDGSNESRSSSSNEAASHSVRDTRPPISIKKELLDDLGEDDENIEMIDDEFDDTLNQSIDLLTDTSVIDELFGRDTLMADFNDINNVIMNDPGNFGNANAEIVQCPICEDRMERSELSSHLDGCNGITVKVDPKRRGKQVSKPLPFYKNQAKPSTSETKVNDRQREMLRLAGYDAATIARMTTETEEAREYNDRIMDELAGEERGRRTSVIQQNPANIETISLDGDNSNSPVPEQHPCPVCNTPVDANLINQHLDDCLLANA